jgi:hypothetical protein
MATDDLKHPSKRSQFNAYNFLVCFLVSLGQIAFGHPASIIGTTLYVQYLEALPVLCIDFRNVVVNHRFMSTWA